MHVGEVGYMSEPRVLVYSLVGWLPCEELERSLRERKIEFEKIGFDKEKTCVQLKGMMRHLFLKMTNHPTFPAVEVIVGTERHWISNEGQEHIQEKVVQQILELAKPNS